MVTPVWVLRFVSIIKKMANLGKLRGATKKIYKKFNNFSIDHGLFDLKMSLDSDF